MIRPAARRRGRGARRRGPGPGGEPGRDRTPTASRTTCSASTPTTSCPRPNGPACTGGSARPSRPAGRPAVRSRWPSWPGTSCSRTRLSAQAWEYSVAAAREAAARLAYEEAVRHWEHAAAAADARPADRTGALLELAEARRRAGQGQAAGQAYLRAAERARAAQDPAAAGPGRARPARHRAPASGGLRPRWSRCSPRPSTHSAPSRNGDAAAAARDGEPGPGPGLARARSAAGQDAGGGGGGGRPGGRRSG